MASTDPGVPAPPILGRGAELGALRLALTEASSPGSRVVIVRGEAGIGKSALLEQFCRDGRRRAAIVAGRADPIERGVPYAPLHHALSCLAPVPAAIQPLVDDVLDAIRRAGRTIAPGSDRFGSVLDSVWLLVGALAEARPLVLAVDDLHCTDQDTIALLQGLARRAVGLPVLFVVTVRSNPPFADAAVDRFLAAVDEQCLTTTIGLGPLVADSVSRVLATLLGTDPSPALVETVMARTGGNPFFVRELAAGLVDDGRLPDPASAVSGRAFAMIQRLFPAGGPALLLARVLSAMGNLTVSHLEAAGRAAGLDPDDAVKTFDGLLRSELIGSGPDGGYRFRHDILREALYSDLGPAERQRIHTELLRGLLDLRGGGTHVERAVLAEHAVRAVDGPAETAAAFAQEAGDEIGDVAPRSAVPWYAASVDLTPPGSPLRPMRIARHARALIRANCLHEGIATGKAALAGLVDETERARCLALIAEAELRCGHGDVLPMLDAEQDQGLDHPRLLLTRLAAMAEQGRCSEAAALADRTLPKLPAGNGSDALVAVSCSAQIADALGRFDEVEALIDEQLRRAERLPVASRLFVFGSASAYFATHGRIDRAELLLKQAEALHDDDGSLGADERLGLAAVFIDHHRGDWDEALLRAARLRAVLDEPEQAAGLLVSLIESSIRACRGDLVGARNAAGTLADDAQPRTRAIRYCANGWVELVDRRFDEAGTRFEAALETATGAFVPMLHSYAARACHGAGRQSEAAEHLAAADRYHLTDTLPAVAVERLLARAEVTGDAGAAIAAYEKAEVASLAFLAAQAQLRRGLLADEPKETLGDALRRFRRLGADIWRARAAAALRDRNLPVPRAPRRQPNRLSEIEKEVARLVHAGLSNQEIADRLSYSKHTINAYLTRIYARTEFTSRFDLVRAVADGVEL